jgi:LPXTG-site transpeptidase (sortase) family protein
MAGRCPYLGLMGKRNQVYLVSSPRHRCYVQGQQDRIGSAHQAEICLTTAHRRCPRLVTRGAGSQMQEQESTQAQTLPAPTSSRVAAKHIYSAGAASRENPPLPYTELRSASASRASKPQRRWNITELAVLVLGLAILLAISFIGYAVIYRLRVGTGMIAAPHSGEGLVAENLAAEAAPTLVPTFTPTPVPTSPAQVAEPAAMSGTPTSIPEPTLPVPGPITRPPADLPPTRLVIPKIAVDIPVLPVGVKTIQEKRRSKVVWADVPNAGAFHLTSAYPGNPGNTVINGHRDIQGAVFRHLDQVEPGDEIVLYAGEVAYPYLVTETLVVPDTFATAEQRSEGLRLIGFLPEERLTLVTCTPVGLATHRLLVVAKPPDQFLPEMPEAGSDSLP